MAVAHLAEGKGPAGRWQVSWLSRLFRRKSVLPPGFTIEELKFTREYGIELRARYPHISVFADETARFFREQKGINFVTFAMWAEEIGFVNIEVRRGSGKPLAQVLGELRAENTRLQEEIKRLTESPKVAK